MRLSCFRIKKLLNRLVDKELPNERSLKLLRGHLKQCPHCNKELDYLYKVKGVIAEKEKVAAPEDFLIKLRERLEPEPQIIRLRWVVDMGALSKKLIPVPVAIMVLVMVLLFGKIGNEVRADEDLIGALTNAEAIVMEAYLMPLVY